MLGGQLAEALCGALRGDITLRLAQQLVPDHELAHGGRPEERWVEVGMQVPLGMRRAVGGGQMEAHGVGEGDLEEVIVAGGQLLQDVRQRPPLLSRERGRGSDGPAADYQGLERPHRPEGHQGHEVLVLADEPRSIFLHLQNQVVAEQCVACLIVISKLHFLLSCDFGRQVLGGPDLPMRVGVAGAHHGPAVLEDLNVIDERERTQFLILCHPRLDHDAQRVRIDLGERQVVVRGEANHPAGSAHALCPEDTPDLVASGRCVGQECGKVVGEHEGLLVGWVALAASAFVAWAEVARGVIGRPALRRVRLDLTLPGPLGAMG